jgi:hypothetical protein
MTDLSPATQAIIDASNCAGSRCVQLHIADALRALAVRINGADAIRQDVLDIADELEASELPTLRRYHTHPRYRNQK